MTRVKVVVDSSSGISPELAARWNVGVVPMHISWNGVNYREGVDIFPTDFYRKLTELDVNPQTAAPNPADFARAFASYAAEGYSDVVVVTPAASLSGMGQNANLGARDAPGVGVSVVDSGQGAGSHALIAAHAARVANEGAHVAAVVAAIEDARERVIVWMCLDTLRYLKRSGRISGARALAGDAVRMKVIVSFVNGALSVVDRPLTRVRATGRLLGRLDRLGPKVEHVMAMYSDDPGDGEELAGLVRQRLDHSSVTIDTCSISAVVGGNCGPGTRGLAALWA